MAAIIEVKYFNTYILKKTMKAGGADPVWAGSFGIPQSKGGFDRGSINDDNNWAIEESRIRGGYNNTSTDYGAKAYLVEDEPNSSNRINSLIYSGIFNSRTGINNTNVFSIGEEITKSVDPANGSIQKLFAEDTNLIIFQEKKVSRALIDKDAIYAAEGGGAVTAANLTIGTIQPYKGMYGISKDPQSFSVYGYGKYFSDKNNNAIMRLSQNGLEEISRYGMKDYFRDELNNIDRSGSDGNILGGWDIHNKQYVVSSQENPIKFPSSSNFNTLTFDETVKGWTSFFSYKPDHMFSLRNNFYSIKNGQIWQHYASLRDFPTAKRGNFYGVQYDTSVTFVFNPQVNKSKNFKTINYEGSNGWQIDSILSDATGEDAQKSNTDWFSYQDTTVPITNPTTPAVYSFTEGKYDSAGNVYPNANQTPFYYAGFNRKENKYTANLVNTSGIAPGEILFGPDMSGIKGFFATVKISTDSVTNVGAEKELFCVGSEYVANNGY
jgi:hypothetical protein